MTFISKMTPAAVVWDRPAQQIPGSDKNSRLQLLNDGYIRIAMDIYLMGVQNKKV